MVRSRPSFPARLTTALFALCLGAGGPVAAQGAGPNAGAGRLEELTAAAPNRVAFVIGNGDYLHAPDLGNPVADAALVAEFLTAHGYRVFAYENLDKLGFEALLQQAYYEVDADSEVVFYYAGHGLQVAGQNYLLPTDSELDSPYDLPFEAVSLSNVVDIIGALARTQLYILDSCRENPFSGADMAAGVTAALSETEQGFSTLTAPVNSLISFSSSPGERAADGVGAHSPFTDALIAAARADPDRSVSQILEDVRRKVYEQTGGTQVPWESSTLVQPIRFGGPTVMAHMSLGAEMPPGDFRSWLDRAMPEVTVVATEPMAEAGAGNVVHSTAPLEREVSLEPTLASLRTLPMDTVVELTIPPAGGRLVIVRPGAMRIDVAPGQRMPVALLEHAVYERDMPPRGVDAPPAPPSRDAFVVSTAAGDALEVQMDLEPDACDLAAGARLDPQGVGVELYANQIDPATALPACEAAVARDPQNGRFHFQLGRVQLALRDLDAAEAAFRRAAELGHVRAFHALGQVAAFRAAAVAGAGAQSLPPEARDFYEKGVAAGDPFAFHALGKQLLRHGATDAERRRGFDLLQRAVETGHTYSMNELGLYYLDKDSPDRDPARGIRYFEESARRGDIYGFTNIGLAYRDGRGGLPIDLEKAETFLRRAVEGAHPAAPRYLGLLYVEGKLAAEDPDRAALDLFDIGLDRGDAWSGVNGAWTILNRDVEGYKGRDASLRAIKALSLEGAADAVARAETYLSEMPGPDLGAGLQLLVNETIGLLEAQGKPHPDPVTVDGAFGAGSAAALEAVLRAVEIPSPAADPLSRARALSRAYWTIKGIRIDTL